ncbi:MAG: T9SS type A sorting domain-containing protein [Ignavibacteria bacterium]
MWSDLYSICFINNTTGWVSGGWTEVYKTTNGGNVFISNISNEIPDSYCLFQNYPNPFNPATIIRFQVKETKYVTLKIFDILGKEIQTLVSEKHTPGLYEVFWDASAFPSGVYFYRMITDGFSETKRMILVR